MSDTPKATTTMSEAKCEVCGRCGAERLRHVEIVGVGRVCPGSFFTWKPDEAQRANERAEGLQAILKRAVEVTGAPYPAGETSTGQVAQWCRVCGQHSGRHLPDCWIPAAREAIR